LYISPEIAGARFLMYGIGGIGEQPDITHVANKVAPKPPNLRLVDITMQRRLSTNIAEFRNSKAPRFFGMEGTEADCGTNDAHGKRHRCRYYQLNMASKKRYPNQNRGH
jgi:hypothetical protein